MNDLEMHYTAHTLSVFFDIDLLMSWSDNGSVVRYLLRLVWQLAALFAHSFSTLCAHLIKLSKLHYDRQPN